MDSVTAIPQAQLLREILEWVYGSFLRRCTHPQFATLLEYVTNVGVDPALALRVYRNVGLDGRCRGSPIDFTALQDLFGELFKVPKLEQLFRIDKAPAQNELMVGFITFLLRLLRLAHKDSLSRFSVINDRVVKELEFLVTVLGDSPFQAVEHEQVQSLLAEFEQVANHAGTLVLSLIFDPVPVMDDAIASLLKHMDCLQTNMMIFLNLLPSIVIFPKANDIVDSIFIVHSLLYDLGDLMGQDDNQLVEVKDQIKALHQWLRLSVTLLDHIKVPQHSEGKELKEAMLQIRDVAYESEYLIKKNVHAWYLTIRLTHVNCKLELIAARLQVMKQKYGIRAVQVEEDFRSRAQSSLRTRIDYGVDDTIVCSKDMETDILDQLVRGRGQLQINFIVGMPGIGKTTLAKKLYNHVLVRYYFDHNVWCVVSQVYRRKNLLVDILISITGDLDTVKSMDEESLSLRIYQSLKGRRYQIVIDDVWDSNVWEDLQRIFPNDGNGSGILFTSRNKDAAPYGSIIHELPLLSDDQCWELLQKKVFQDKVCPLQLERIGKDIAAKCHGLPLAVVVIAGVLSTVDAVESTWENVGGSLNTYMLSDQNNSVMHILELSYKYLPRHLKPCFLYFGLFPEGKKISVKMLKWLWISEGFIHKEEAKGVESIAQEYLTELMDKSLVTVAEKQPVDGGAKACVIHDLLRDLCLRIAENESFLKVSNRSYSSWNHINSHRLCILRSEEGENPLSALYNQRLRTFFGPCGLLSSCEGNMKLLRVLDCRFLFHRSLVPQFKFLVNLRFLATYKMPKSIHTLVNLEFLTVDEGGIHISSKVLKMAKLKYLNVGEAFFADDCDTSQTNILEYFSCIRILTQENIEMLKCSSNLRKLKCVCDGSWEKNEVNRCLDLHFLTRLESLKVDSCGKVMTGIKFPSGIKSLHLSGFSLPWEKMSIVGTLPNLEILKLDFYKFNGERWDTNDDEFQQLRYLKLCSPDLTYWNVSYSQHFPKLQELVLQSCYLLLELPSEMAEIATLQLISVGRYCGKTVKESARRIQRQLEEIGNEVLVINVDEKASV